MGILGTWRTAGRIGQVVITMTMDLEMVAVFLDFWCLFFFFCSVFLSKTGAFGCRVGRLATTFKTVDGFG